MRANGGRNRRQVVTIRNRQRTRAVNVRHLRRIATAVLADHFGIAEFRLNICLVGAREITRLNEVYLRHQGSTDVLAFDYHEPTSTACKKCRSEGSLSSFAGEGKREEASVSKSPLPNTGPDLLFGEIFVCVDEAGIQARRFRTTWKAELVRYVVHGLLHLCGYDDRRSRQREKMKRVENRLLRLLSSQFSIQDLAVSKARTKS